MEETFAKPAIGAIIEKNEHGEDYILIQERKKKDDRHTNGLLEFVGGKIREYEDIFLALKREVYEETGLNVTKIYGEEECVREQIGGVNTMNCDPFCVTQNLDGIYSIIMMTFICNAEGEPAENTNETTNIHWAKLGEIEKILNHSPELIFPMDVLPLKKYIRLKKDNN